MKVFFGKKEDFGYFSEQFEARMYLLKLNKFLDGTVVNTQFVPTLRSDTQRSKMTMPIKSK